MEMEGIGIVRKNGDSKYIVIKAEICKYMNIEDGDYVKYTIENVKKINEGE